MAQKVHPTRLRVGRFQQSHAYWYASCNAAGVLYADCVYQSLFEEYRAQNMQVESCADRYIVCNFWQLPWCVQTYTTDAVIGMTQATHRPTGVGGQSEGLHTVDKRGVHNVHAIADTVSGMLLREDRAREKVNHKSTLQLAPGESSRTGKTMSSAVMQLCTQCIPQVQKGRFVFMKVHQPTAANVCAFVIYALQRGTHPRTKTRLYSFKDIWKVIANRLQPWLHHTAHIRGVKITCSGRLQGAELAQTQTRKIGETSVQRFSDTLEYAFAKAQTQYGAIGVKVWLQR